MMINSKNTQPSFIKESNIQLISNNPQSTMLKKEKSLSMMSVFKDKVILIFIILIEYDLNKKLLILDLD